MLMSNLRCPRSSCEYYGRRLVLEVGQHETRGEMTVRHYCLGCLYSEEGPTTVEAAKKTSDTVKRAMTPLRELLYRQRVEGTVIPLRKDATPPWPTSQPPNPTPPAPTTNPKTPAEPTSTNPTPAADDTDQLLLDDGWPDVAKPGGAG